MKIHSELCASRHRTWERKLRCYRCDIWFRSRESYRGHCRQHLQDLDRYSGILRLRNIEVSGGRCPFCLADSSLKDAERWDVVLTQFITSDSFRSHLLGHIHLLRQQNAPVNCPHSRCSDTGALTWQDLLHHCWDDHGITEDLFETEKFPQPSAPRFEESLFVRSDEESDTMSEVTPGKKEIWDAKPFSLEELIHDIRVSPRLWDHTCSPICTEFANSGLIESEPDFLEVLVDLEVPRRTWVHTDPPYCTVLDTNSPISNTDGARECGFDYDASSPEVLVSDLVAPQRTWDHTLPPLYTVFAINSTESDSRAQEFGVEPSFSEVLADGLVVPQQSWERAGSPVSGVSILRTGARNSAADITQILLQSPSLRRDRKRPGLWRKHLRTVQDCVAESSKILLQPSSPQRERKRPGLWRTHPRTARV